MGHSFFHQCAQCFFLQLEEEMPPSLFLSFLACTSLLRQVREKHMYSGVCKPDRHLGREEKTEASRLQDGRCLQRIEKEQYDQYGFFVGPRLPRRETICSLSMDHLLVWLVGRATSGRRAEGRRERACVAEEPVLFPRRALERPGGGGRKADERAGLRWRRSCIDSCSCLLIKAAGARKGVRKAASRSRFLREAAKGQPHPLQSFC